MTKAELIGAVAREAKITKAAAGEAIDAITDTITKDLQQGGRVTLTGVWNLFCGKPQGQNRQKPTHRAGDPDPGQQDPKVHTGKGVEEGGEVKPQR